MSNVILKFRISKRVFTKGKGGGWDFKDEPGNIVGLPNDAVFKLALENQKRKDGLQHDGTYVATFTEPILG